MNAKQFLANKGVHNLDTKKRYNEVIAWMEEYAALRQPPVVCSCLSEEFVENFTSDGELTPIDIVSEITGLTYNEIRSCSKIVRVP